MGESSEPAVREEGEGDAAVIGDKGDDEVVALHDSDAQPRMS
jgi:hypothetical protein